MTNSILSSKLYITSSVVAKKRIHAALSDPLNAELVAQFARDLDPEYQTKENLIPEDKLEAEQAKADQNENEDTRTTGEESTEDTIDKPERSDRHASSAPSPMSSPSVSDAPIAKESEETSAPEPAKPVEDSSVEESVKVSQTQKVMATSFPRDSFPTDMKQKCDNVKAILNMNSATAGVDRVEIKFKDNEFWIYYSDEINLNNVMAPVVELLNQFGYTEYSFNRLGRKYNAVIFDYKFADTNNTVKPISQLPKQPEVESLEEITNVTVEQ